MNFGYKEEQASAIFRHNGSLRNMMSQKTKFAFYDGIGCSGSDVVHDKSSASSMTMTVSKTTTATTTTAVAAVDDTAPHDVPRASDKVHQMMLDKQKRLGEIWAKDLESAILSSQRRRFAAATVIKDYPLLICDETNKPASVTTLALVPTTKERQVSSSIVSNVNCTSKAIVATTSTISPTTPPRCHGRGFAHHDSLVVATTSYSRASPARRYPHTHVVDRSSSSGSPALLVARRGQSASSPSMPPLSIIALPRSNTSCYSSSSSISSRSRSSSSASPVRRRRNVHSPPPRQLSLSIDDGTTTSKKKAVVATLHTVFEDEEEAATNNGTTTPHQQGSTNHSEQGRALVCNKTTKSESAATSCFFHAWNLPWKSLVSRRRHKKGARSHRSKQQHTKKQKQQKHEYVALDRLPSQLSSRKALVASFQ